MLKRLKDLGLTNRYEDYFGLPVGVLDDALMLMEFENRVAEAKHG